MSRRGIELRSDVVIVGLSAAGRLIVGDARHIYIRQATHASPTREKSKSIYAFHVDMQDVMKLAILLETWQAELEGRWPGTFVLINRRAMLISEFTETFCAHIPPSTVLQSAIPNENYPASSRANRQACLRKRIAEVSET
jgi:hypothetical protein